MGTGYSSACSICTHPHAQTINAMLARRALGEKVTYMRIIEQVEKLGGPTITECALSRHVSKHFDVHAEGRRRASEQYDEAAEEVKAKVITDIAVLDLIRDEGMKLIENGELKPDVKDVISAIGTKNSKVLKDENPVEEAIRSIVEAARMASGGGE